MKQFNFKFTFTVCLKDLDYPHQGESTYKAFLSRFQHLSKLFGFECAHYESSAWDADAQVERLCIGITLSRQVRQFRNAYNLLRVCESSLEIFVPLYQGVVFYKDSDVVFLSDS